MKQQYCTRAPGTKPGMRRKCQTYSQALALSRRYEIQQCPKCQSWHFYTALPTKPQPPAQPEAPRPGPEAQAYGAQILADLRTSLD